MTDKTKKYGLTESSIMSESDLIDNIESIIYAETAKIDANEIEAAVRIKQIFDDIKKQLIEQACEAVYFAANNYEFTVENVQQAIRDNLCQKT